MTEHEALQLAIRAAGQSGCLLSRRGVVIWRPPGGPISTGANRMPDGVCDGSKACKALCGKRCVHAEAAALLKLGKRARGCEMLHVKVVDGRAVTSKEPSCWQCSRLILAAEIAGMWLLVDVDGVPTLRRWTALEFHLETLKNRGLDLPTHPDADLLRVVHYPGEPHDLGVVSRARRADGEVMPGLFVVLWCGGHVDQIDAYDRLGPPHGKVVDGAMVYPRVTRVSADPVHCRRILEWSEAAYARGS